MADNDAKYETLGDKLLHIEQRESVTGLLDVIRGLKYEDKFGSFLEKTQDGMYKIKGSGMDIEANRMNLGYAVWDLAAEYIGKKIMKEEGLTQATIDNLKSNDAMWKLFLAPFLPDRHEFAKVFLKQTLQSGNGQFTTMDLFGNFQQLIVQQHSDQLEKWEYDKVIKTTDDAQGLYKHLSGQISSNPGKFAGFNLLQHDFYNPRDAKQSYDMFLKQAGKEYYRGEKK